MTSKHRLHDLSSIVPGLLEHQCALLILQPLDASFLVHEVIISPSHVLRVDDLRFALPRHYLRTGYQIECVA